MWAFAFATSNPKETSIKIDVFTVRQRKIINISGEAVTSSNFTVVNLLEVFDDGGVLSAESKSAKSFCLRGENTTERTY